VVAENDNPEQENTHFELDGIAYEMPELRDLDIDEWMIVYKYSKVVLRDLMEVTDDPEAEQARVDKLEQPGVMKALFHIAYKRKHPRKTDAAVEALVGQIKYLPTLEAMNTDDGEEAPEEEDPTQETTEPESEPSEPEPQLLRSTDSPTGNGSSASTESSETPEGQPATTGTSG
jgi:hypothetical protein